MAEGRATIYDVAKKAGVSVATVSRFINRSVPVGEKSRKRIMEAIDALHYVPDPIAKSLKTSCSNLIMMVVPDISNEFYAELYKVIQKTVGSYGYSIVLTDTAGSASEEEQALQVAQKYRCDGLIVFSLDDSRSMEQRIRELEVPYFYNLTNLDREHGIEKRIYLTARHLIAYGHRNIIYVGGTPGTYVNQVRKNAFMKAMQENHLYYDEKDCVELGFSLEAGIRAGRLVAQKKPLPTAICAANDQVAFGVMLALDECGIRVPEDISVTGMDDVPFARMITPKLTTIRNDYSSLALKISASLLKQLGETVEDQTEYAEYKPEVIVRDSTRKLT